MRNLLYGTIVLVSRHIVSNGGGKGHANHTLSQKTMATFPTAAVMPIMRTDKQSIQKKNTGLTLPKLHVKSFHPSTLYALEIALQQMKWTRDAKIDGSHDIHWHRGRVDDDEYEDYVGAKIAINKFPGTSALTDKVNFTRLMERMKQLYPYEYNFYPKTWILPEDADKFAADPAICNSELQGRQNRFFIVKPGRGYNGDGIRLVKDPTRLDKIAVEKKSILQEYIARSLLLDGFKFDIRIFVLIARLDPLEIYVCKDGIARLCTEAYQPPSEHNMENRHMHLTNYHLNRESKNYVRTKSPQTGSKRTLSSIKTALADSGCNATAMWKEISRIAVKTVQAMVPDLHNIERKNVTKSVRCFQTLGLDVMLSDDLNLHLLEVNGSPSYGIVANMVYDEKSKTFTPVFDEVDMQVKVPLLKDTLALTAAGEDALDMESTCLERVYPVQG